MSYIWHTRCHYLCVIYLIQFDIHWLTGGKCNVIFMNAIFNWNFPLKSTMLHRMDYLYCWYTALFVFYIPIIITTYFTAAFSCRFFQPVDILYLYVSCEWRPFLKHLLKLFSEHSMHFLLFMQTHVMFVIILEHVYKANVTSLFIPH